MENHTSSSSVFLFIFFLLFTQIYSAFAGTTIASEDDDNVDELKTYIIQVQVPSYVPLDAENLTSWYQSFLPESYSSTEEESRLVHTYSEVFKGFSARLKEEEVKEMAKKDGFVRAYPSHFLQLQTTHSPSFLGLQLDQGLWKSSNLGKGVVIGLLDTGVSPDHPSFHDDGVPRWPTNWKGWCEFRGKCNNKLIGARNLISGQLFGSPSDEIGHGTHTAGTAAGNFVRNASAFGLAEGTAAGMAPHAHVAMYKVCASRGCADADVLAGVDAAVKDGVDVLSISLGKATMGFTDDPVAIGTFKAAEKGIIVSCAAGNDGPKPSTVINEAPWMLTVAASTIDRSLRATVKLGNGREIDGESLDQSQTFNGNSLPLFYTTSPGGSTCDFFDSQHDLEGRVVVCDPSQESTRQEIVANVENAGGVAVIFINSEKEGYTLLVRRSNIAAVQVSFADGPKIKSYAMSVNNPTISIAFKGTVLGASPAPSVAFFSSRGPSRASPGILKPDITGPGVNILAAWPAADVNGNYFNIISGTSMATPHLSGIAALIRSVHRDWSPAAIKSAIMTTSTILDVHRKPILNEKYQRARFFDMGAGHVNPSKAIDPGLVYDLGVDDYIGYICGKYGNAGARAIVHSHYVNCAIIKNIAESELNYPSISIILPKGKEITVHRTVTNVGPANSTYKVRIQVPMGVSVRVSPGTLNFSKINEKKTFSISVKRIGRRKANVEGNLRWISAQHVVRSPIVIS